MSDETQKKDNTITKTQAAVEVLRREKTLKVCTIFNIVAIFMCAITWQISTLTGGLFIIAGVAYNAYVLYNSQNMIKSLSVKYGL